VSEQEEVLVRRIEVDEVADGERHDSGVDAAFDEVTWELLRMPGGPAADVRSPLDVDVVGAAGGTEDLVSRAHSGPICGLERGVAQELGALAAEPHPIVVVGGLCGHRGDQPVPDTVDPSSDRRGDEGAEVLEQLLVHGAPRRGYRKHNLE
jgi:hypothetical protein